MQKKEACKSVEMSTKEIEFMNQWIDTYMKVYQRKLNEMIAKKQIKSARWCATNLQVLKDMKEKIN